MMRPRSPLASRPAFVLGTSLVLSGLAAAFAPALATAQVVIVPPIPPPPFSIQGRIHWHVRRPRPPVYVTQAPPPVWVAPATPPPPVYVAPPPPPPVVVQPETRYYVVPQPVYQAPCCSQPAAPAPAAVVVAAAPAKPQWASRVGLGATVEGAFAKGESASQGYGILGQLRFRTSRHTALELMAGYEQSVLADGVKRSDVPVTFGLLVPFLGPEHFLSPYLVAAVGVNFSDLRLVDTPDLKLDDHRIQGLGQLGGGLELRLGQHFAINADARLEGRVNAASASAQVSAATVKIDGAVVSPTRDSVGLRLGIGATLYF